MAAQPTGTVTMLFTDVEGSTRLLDRLGENRYSDSPELIVVTFEELALMAAKYRDAAAGAYILGAAAGVRERLGLQAHMGGKRELAMDTVRSSIDEVTY